MRRLALTALALGTALAASRPAAAGFDEDTFARKSIPAFFRSALWQAMQMVPAERETIAWTRWQLGELALQTGDYDTAEKDYRDSLVTFPDYYRALGGLARTTRWSGRRSRKTLPGERRGPYRFRSY